VTSFLKDGVCTVGPLPRWLRPSVAGVSCNVVACVPLAKSFFLRRYSYGLQVVCAGVAGEQRRWSVQNREGGARGGGTSDTGAGGGAPVILVDGEGAGVPQLTVL
jgi:hypothetical protein